MSINAAHALVEAPIRRLSFGDHRDDPDLRNVPVEAPVAFEYDGLAFAVMMATPTDLDDFAIGFTLAEQLVDHPSAIRSIDVALAGGGWIVRVSLNGVARTKLQARARHRLVEGSCGLCGMESIEQVLRPLPPVPTPPSMSRYAVASALAALDARQPLGRATGAAHAAAFCDWKGDLLVVREDVGRHNALDKLTGALPKTGIAPSSGFILLTARCSYELVEKTVLSGCPLLVTISAPTSLAVERARAAGLTLVCLARRDSMMVVNDPHQVFGSIGRD